MAGRPSQLTDPVREAILGHIRNGNYAKDACSACGIGYATFNGWVNQGNKDLQAKKASAFATFVTQIKTARDEATASLVKTIKDASERQWQAAAWLLERTRDKDFADNRAEMRRLAKMLEEAVKSLEQAKTMMQQLPPPPTEPK